MSWWRRLLGLQDGGKKSAGPPAVGAPKEPSKGGLIVGEGSTFAEAVVDAVRKGATLSQERRDSWGRPSSEHGDYVTRAKDLGEEYELSGRWLDDICANATVRVAKAPDVQTFFAQAELPLVFPDRPAYVEGIKSRGEDAQRVVRLGWTEVYLHHPDPKVVVATLDSNIVTDTLGVQHTLAYLLTHGNPDIEGATARSLWAHANRQAESFGYRTLLTVLAGRGMMLSGIDGERAKHGVQLLHAASPPDLSEAQRKDFTSIAKEYFGAGVFGETELSEQEREAAEAVSAVRHVRTDRKPSPIGSATFTYEIYAGDTKAQARAFLETRSVDRPHLYIIVETPEGNVGLDVQGMYEE
ncbi:MAG: hypothetical protein FJX75_11530 [Armatimonadetes bacterium]|nr:hypothetical protein [Armatimonadota bacterium]